jgi:hypothetical protein
MQTMMNQLKPQRTMNVQQTVNRRNNMRNVYTAMLMVFGLVAALPVNAQDQNEEVTIETKIHHHQSLSRRPYQAPVVMANKPAAEQAWKGASMTAGQEQKEKHLQLLRMHSIGKRPL